jgi:hypothetical protein
LRIEMRVVINEAGGDHAPGGVDDALGGGAISLPDADNLAVLYRDIGLERWRPRAVD